MAGLERIDTEVLVAGGGIAGLTAAAAFAARGFDVVCVDAAPPVADGAEEGSDLRSTAFLRPSIAVLEAAGVWERLAPHAAPLRVMRLADAGGRDAAIRETANFEATELGAEVFGQNLPNWLLRRELSAAVKGAHSARLIAPARLERITARSGGVLAALSTGAQVRARLAVGADGRDSAVRAAAGIGVRRWGYGQKALAFTVGHDRPHEGVSTEIHRTGGAFVLVPLNDREGPASAVVWMETAARAEALAAMEAGEFEAALNERACGVLGPLRLTSPRRLWPIVSQIADRLDGPRTALIAEAAHVIPPIGAQGLNMSLRDVDALTGLCAAERDAGGDIGAAGLLRRYHRARHPDILMRVAGVDALNRAAMTDIQPLRDLRRAGMRALHDVAPLRRAAMRLGLGGGR